MKYIWVCPALKYSNGTQISKSLLIRWKQRHVVGCTEKCTHILYICLWKLDSLRLSHVGTRTLSSATRKWILAKETTLLAAKNKVRCSREASLGLQPNLHKAESSLNNKELTVMGKAFLQVQMNVLWNANKPFQMLALSHHHNLIFSVLILMEFFTQGSLYPKRFQMWDAADKKENKGVYCIEIKTK